MEKWISRSALPTFAPKFVQILNADVFADELNMPTQAAQLALSVMILNYLPAEKMKCLVLTAE